MLVKWNEKLIYLNYRLSQFCYDCQRMWKAASELWQNPCAKVNSTPLGGISTKAVIKDGRYIKREFCTLKWKQGSLENYITIYKTNYYRITLDGSTLADKFIKSHQVEYLSSVLIQVKTVGNVQMQEHFAAMRYSKQRYFNDSVRLVMFEYSILFKLWV